MYILEIFTPVPEKEITVEVYALYAQYYVLARRQVEGFTCSAKPPMTACQISSLTGVRCLKGENPVMLAG